MVDVREVIAEAIPCNIVYGRPQAADEIIRALAAAGFRILGKDEVDQVTLEKAADYIEGAGGVIPATVGFAPLVSGNRQPCMSGDGRDRLHTHVRRDFDDATSSLAAAIRAIGGKA